MRMVLRLESAQYILVAWLGLLGWGYGTSAIHSFCTAKVTILTVTSVVTWMWPSCFVMSPRTWSAICPYPAVKVTIVMVMSASNPDVMSSSIAQFCWKTVPVLCPINQMMDVCLVRQHLTVIWVISTGWCEPSIVWVFCVLQVPLSDSTLNRYRFFGCVLIQYKNSLT